MESKERKYNIVSVWEDFCHIETSFKESIRYLPVLPENSEVWSLHYADLLIKIGNVLDSLFRDSISSSDYGGTGDLLYQSNKIRSNLNVGDYGKLYETRQNLSSKKIFFIHDSPKMICPFSEWKYPKEGKYISPSWWDAHNHVKHDRSLCITEATQKNTIDALAGLFLAILSQEEGISRLIDLNVIVSPINNDRLKEIFFEEGSDKSKIEAKAKSLLFGYVFDFNSTKMSDDEILDILSPSHRYPLCINGGSL